MTFSAIMVDPFLTSGMAVGHVAKPDASLIDFAELLASAESWAANDAPQAEPAAAAVSTATRTEVARTVAVAGHLRLTTLWFSDGSSDVEVIAMDADPLQPPAPPVESDIRPPQAKIEALSDLSPEVGVDTAPNRGERGTSWKRWSFAKGSVETSIVTNRRSAPQRTELQARVEAIEESGVGRLVDILT